MQKWLRMYSRNMALLPQILIIAGRLNQKTPKHRWKESDLLRISYSRECCRDIPHWELKTKSMSFWRLWRKWWHVMWSETHQDIHTLLMTGNLEMMSIETWFTHRNCHLRICLHQFHQEMFSKDYCPCNVIITWLMRHHLYHTTYAFWVTNIWKMVSWV